MEMLTADEFLLNKTIFLKKIREGAVFIHPTDTIYGLGCDATNSDAVNRIRVIKKRPDLPFSVIAPSPKWIHENCLVNSAAAQWIEKLPGPYTLILNLKNKAAVAQEVIVETNTLGVRIPDHWFASIASELNLPIVSTSVNITQEKYMTSLKDLNNEIIGKVDFIIFEGDKQAKPSTVVKLFTEKPEIVER